MKRTIQIGEKFNRLTVVSIIITDKKHPKIKCLCDCGNEVSVGKYSLLNGATKSCGCYRTEVAKINSTKHGMRYSKLYNTWRGMVERCTNPKNKKFNNYGGNGICVCED